MCAYQGVRNSPFFGKFDGLCFLGTHVLRFAHLPCDRRIMDNIKLNKPPAYKLRTRQELYIRNKKSVRYGAETIFFGSENLGRSSSKYKKLHVSFIT